VGAPLSFQQTCSYNVKRAIQGPDNWTKYIGTGRMYSDTSMPGDSSMVVWSNYKRTDYAALSSKLGYIRGYKRPTEMERSSPSLWGSRIDYDDIYQGSVGDCYMVSVASALAEYPDRIKKLFVQDSYNKEGIFALKLHVKGKPEYITIDDKLPYGSSTPYFAKKSVDGSWWMPILEKAYAKVFMNYEIIGFGWMSEAARVLTGAPSYRYTSGSMSDTDLWNTLKSADANKYVLTAASMDGLYGLAKGHAYSLLGVYEIKSGSTVVERLVMMRNPWKSETYNGPWKDSDSKWTTSYKSQVPYKYGNDGRFFIPLSNFKQAFKYFTVTYYKDDYSVSYYEQKNFRLSTTYNYEFTISKT